MFARYGESMGWIWNIPKDSLKNYEFNKYFVSPPNSTKKMKLRLTTFLVASINVIAYFVMWNQVTWCCHPHGGQRPKRAHTVPDPI